MSQTNTPENTKKPETNIFKAFWRYKGIRIFVVILLILLLIPVIGYTVIRYGLSKENISQPRPEHLHFRMQYVYNGTAENFADPKYQMAYSKDNCNVALTSEPIHFHDGKDQIVHIHWRGVTGGQVFKYYGLNLIGGFGDTLGYRFDSGILPKKVPTHGSGLPTPSENQKLFVYSGDEKSFQRREVTDWLYEDLESFFGVKSNLNFRDQSNIFGGLPVLAHGSKSLTDANNSSSSSKPSDWKFFENSSSSSFSASTKTEEELKQINNLIGNVVIFVQDSEPSNEQIQDRFKKLEPLSDSTCGG